MAHPPRAVNTRGPATPVPQTTARPDDLPPPAPPAPDNTWALQRTPVTSPVTRIPVVDQRDVPTNARVAGQYNAPVLEDVAREALVNNVPPDLALAMTIRESSTALADPTVEQVANPLTLGYVPEWAGLQNLVSPSILHLIERASAVANQGRERQIQAFQGLGAQPAGYNQQFAGQPNPYAKAVEDIRQKVVGASPALGQLISRIRPTYSLDRSVPEAEAITASLDRRRRNPGLLR